jgi:chemotaxis family two-component system response regulator Rcp1
VSAEQSGTTRVLVVEDNPVDVELLRLALAEEPAWPVETVIAEDGEKAISLINRQAADPTLRKPDLIVLDLNVPRRDGTEVLRAIRSTQGLSNVPVAILSSSPGDVIQDRLTAAHVTADGHFTKPSNIDDFLQLGRALHLWYEQQGRMRRQGCAQ